MRASRFRRELMSLTAYSLQTCCLGGFGTQVYVSDFSANCDSDIVPMFGNKIDCGEVPGIESAVQSD